jgi:hypothetical protein
VRGIEKENTSIGARKEKSSAENTNVFVLLRM